MKMRYLNLHKLSVWKTGLVNIMHAIHCKTKIVELSTKYIFASYFHLIIFVLVLTDDTERMAHRSCPVHFVK